MQNPRPSQLLRTAFRGAAIGVLCATPLGALGDVVILRDGDLIEGKVTYEGDRVSVQSPAYRFPRRPIALRWRDIEFIDTERAGSDYLRERREAVTGADADTLVESAAWAERAGWCGAATELYRLALRRDPYHSVARRALGRPGSDDPVRRRGAFGGWRVLELHGESWRLPAESIETAARDPKTGWTPDEARADAAFAALNGGGTADPPHDQRVAALDPVARRRPAMKWLRGGAAGTRLLAARMLCWTKDEDAIRALLAAAIHDPDERVRTQAAASLRENEDALLPLARALWSGSSALRARAARGLREAACPGAAALLIARLETSDPTTLPQLLAIAARRRYVRDLDPRDPEVLRTTDASLVSIPAVARVPLTAAPADPISATERTQWFALLRAISGQSFGDSLDEWKRWAASMPQPGAQHR